VTHYLVNVIDKATGETVYARTADEGQVDRRVRAEAARWAPTFEVQVVPYDGGDPIRVEPCTGNVTRIN
jgi:hypothetical protein